MAEFTAAERRSWDDWSTWLKERELSKELGALEESFHEWRRGSINASDLSQVIHEFHDGSARDLYASYDRLKPDVLVARALAHGVLTETDVAAGIRVALRSQIAYYSAER